MKSRKYQFRILIKKLYLTRRNSTWLSAGCRDFMTPGPTVEQVAEKANRNIRKLASLAAGKDKAYRKRLIEKYTVGPS